jgi:hypothetical protein
MTSRNRSQANPASSRMRRRRFLRGFGGAIVGLPFLEAMTARGAGAQAATPVKRFGVFFCCNGVDMTRWFPKGAYGALTDAHLTGTANEALIPLRSKLLFPRGVHMTPRGFDRDGGGADDHGKGMAHKLTAQFADDLNWLALGPSVDQVIAGQVNPGTDGARRPPLNLMVGRRGNYKGMDYISYTAAGQAVAGINNPWNAYAEFMNLNDSDPEAAAARMRILQRRQSVLDLVQTQFEDLKRGPLSADDKQKLDAHFTAIREIETGMGATGISCLDQGVSDRAQPFDGMPARTLEQEVNYPVVADLHVDILAIALACDYTRVATVNFGNGAGGPIFKWDGMSHEYNHHKLSHGKVKDDCFGDSTANGCEDVVGYEDMLNAIDRWHASKYARLLTKLNSYTEADGKTVLDNSVVMYTNELSDGKGHSFMDLPYILAGSCGGFFKQNEYVLLGQDGRAEDQRAPHNKLLNTLVNAMGIQSDWFGVAEGMGGTTMQAGVYDALLV